MDTNHDISVRINQVVELFTKHDSWEERYRELIKLGRSLEPLEDEHKEEKFRVKGCQSQVWLFPEFKDGRVYFRADSDALLVKGIIGILIKVYSGATPDEILTHKPDFLKQVGITDHLSMNRTNGLAAMTKQIQLYAMAFKAIS